MTSLSKIKNAGFDVSLCGDGFEITPSSQLTTNQREFLKSHKAEIVSELKAENNNAVVSCGRCLNFKCHNQHGRGAGNCLVGVDNNFYSLWSETLHQCTKFNAAIEYKDYVVNDDALIVTCFTPNGKPIEVVANSPEHAEWLRRMNPPRGITP
ncbi:hypothetical protein [Methylobacter psychrophilus]|uniref:hypothetical protein n=1 Tax=Methylobacter psychrophilus TaxID=96941 RepID=UPI0021D4F7E7|nr:hypothetical protein [Methylobacter psychrophilus]